MFVLPFGDVVSLAIVLVIGCLLLAPPGDFNSEARWLLTIFAIVEPEIDPFGDRLCLGDICFIKEFESSAFLSWMLGILTKQWSFVTFLPVSVLSSFFLKSFKSKGSVFFGLLGFVAAIGERRTLSSFLPIVLSLVIAFSDFSF